MITITPFRALRPEAQLARQVASRPYDVLSSKEAKIEAQETPARFLHITKSEIDLPRIPTYTHRLFMIKQKITWMLSSAARSYSGKANHATIYLPAGDEWKNQTGLVCGSSVADYENDLIKKHEFTRPKKNKTVSTISKPPGGANGQCIPGL